MASLAPDNIDGVRVLRISGTLNQDGVEQLRPSLAAAAHLGGTMVINLAGVDMVNTPGIALLLAAHRDAQRAGGKLIVTGSSNMVNDTLRRCLLDRILVLVPDPVEAVARAKA